MSYVSRNWKPVNVGGSSITTSRGAISNNKHNAGWYKNLVSNESRWKERMERYRSMDMTIDINRALDVIAEDISSENADDEIIFELLFADDNKDNNSTQIKTVEKTLKAWEGKTEFDYKFFDYAREMLKYGICIFEVKKGGELQKLRPDRIRGYIMEEKDDTKVRAYLYDRNGTFYSESGEKIHHNIQNKSEELEALDIKKLFILKNGDDPLGESVLERVYRVWKQMVLLEDAVVIYRIVRAPERRVFYVDIGKMPAHKAESYVEKVKARMNQRQIVNRGNGQLESEYNPQSMQEDFYLAQSGEGRGSRVETLAGGDNLGRIEDMLYFQKKLATGLRIPVSYMENMASSEGGGVHQDGRVGTAYITELRYAGYIQRLQKRISKSIFTNFRKFAVKYETELPEDLEFKIAPPQSFAIYKQNELSSVLLNTFSSADGIDVLSKRESMKKFLDMEEDDLVENETAKLMEMGFTEKDIKEFPDEVTYNFVYSDGEAGKAWIEEELVKQGDLRPELTAAAQNAGIGAHGEFGDPTNATTDTGADDGSTAPAPATPKEEEEKTPPK